MCMRGIWSAQWIWKEHSACSDWSPLPACAPKANRGCSGRCIMRCHNKAEFIRSMMMVLDNRFTRADPRRDLVVPRYGWERPAERVTPRWGAACRSVPRTVGRRPPIHAFRSHRRAQRSTRRERGLPATGRTRIDAALRAAPFRATYCGNTTTHACRSSAALSAAYREMGTRLDCSRTDRGGCAAWSAIRASGAW